MSGFQLVPTWVESGVGVQGPAMWYGPDAPDGDAEPWSTVPTGSLYMYKSSNTADGVLYRKATNNGADADWIVIAGSSNSSIILGQGSTSVPVTTATASKNFLGFWVESTATSGDARGMYLRLYFSGTGVSGEAARIFGTINNKTVATGGTVNGAHISLGTAGASAAVSGAANALRCTFGIAAASTALGGTCSVIQVDTDFDTAVTVPPNFAFLRLTNTNTKKANNFLRLPNVVAETGGLFCAHITQTMTHSIKIVSEDGTAYYIMCTNANTNRTEA